MDVLIFIMFIAFMLLLLPYLFSIDKADVETDEEGAPLRLNGRPGTCLYHDWKYNEKNRLFCSRCGRTPGEMQ